MIYENLPLSRARRGHAGLWRPETAWSRFQREPASISLGSECIEVKPSVWTSREIATGYTWHLLLRNSITGASEKLERALLLIDGNFTAGTASRDDS